MAAIHYFPDQCTVANPCRQCRGWLRFGDEMALDLLVHSAELAPAHFVRRCSERIAFKTPADVEAFMLLRGIANGMMAAEMEAVLP